MLISCLFRASSSSRAFICPIFRFNCAIPSSISAIAVACTSRISSSGAGLSFSCRCSSFSASSYAVCLLIPSSAVLCRRFLVSSISSAPQCSNSSILRSPISSCPARNAPILAAYSFSSAAVVVIALCSAAAAAPSLLHSLVSSAVSALMPCAFPHSGNCVRTSRLTDSAEASSFSAISIAEASSFDLACSELYLPASASILSMKRLWSLSQSVSHPCHVMRPSTDLIASRTLSDSVSVMLRPFSTLFCNVSYAFSALLCRFAASSRCRCCTSFLFCISATSSRSACISFIFSVILLSFDWFSSIRRVSLSRSFTPMPHSAQRLSASLSARLSAFFAFRVSSLLFAWSSSQLFCLSSLAISALLANSYSFLASLTAFSIGASSDWNSMSSCTLSTLWPHTGQMSPAESLARASFAQSATLSFCLSYSFSAISNALLFTAAASASGLRSSRHLRLRLSVSSSLRSAASLSLRFSSSRSMAARASFSNSLSRSASSLLRSVSPGDIALSLRFISSTIFCIATFSSSAFASSVPLVSTSAFCASRLFSSSASSRAYSAHLPSDRTALRNAAVMVCMLAYIAPLASSE